jgi:hypothetical protein
MHACESEEKNSWVMPQTLCHFTLSPLHKVFHLDCAIPSASRKGSRMTCQCSCHRSDDRRPVTPDHDAVESTATLMSRIDGKIAKTREQLGGLLSQRNLMVTVNRLPTELLSLVFTMTQELWRESDPLRLAVTHVCKQWRDVALNCSALWNYIEIGSSSGLGLDALPRYDWSQNTRCIYRASAC